MQSDYILEESIGSFANMKTDDEFYILAVRDQFFIYDYDNNFFFKYLARHGAPL